MDVAPWYYKLMDGRDWMGLDGIGWNWMESGWGEV